MTIGGHVGADLITLCSMLRIPVTMHNVADEKVYRPHVWSSLVQKILKQQIMRLAKTTDLCINNFYNVICGIMPRITYIEEKDEMIMHCDKPIIILPEKFLF